MEQKQLHLLKYSLHNISIVERSITSAIGSLSKALAK